MKVITAPAELTGITKKLPTPIILVPTMGALHQGHLALVKHARQLAGESGSVIVSIFVNPTQFDRQEDLNNYPHSLEKDLEHCKAAGVDLVFTPSPETIYHPDHSIKVTESSLTGELCGKTRPGHFDGVCTIVLKLFNITQATTAVFGKKDYQQLAIIKRMTRDLNIPIYIEGLETVREPSGLALSSRNERLTKKHRQDAARIHQALLNSQQAYLKGEKSAKNLLRIAQETIDSSTEDVKIDYLELLDAESLQPIASVDRRSVMATAIFYGKVRLIDNIEIG